MEATDKLSVELEAQQWNQLLQLLHEVAAPMRLTLPLAQAIERQCNPQSVPSEAGNGALRANGGDAHASD